MNYEAKCLKDRKASRVPHFCSLWVHEFQLLCLSFILWKQIKQKSKCNGKWKHKDRNKKTGRILFLYWPVFWRISLATTLIFHCQVLHGPKPIICEQVKYSSVPMHKFNRNVILTPGTPLLNILTPLNFFYGCVCFNITFAWF